ncbi:hypothetical protein FSW04_07220 [Baekduia soli]|uniref:Fumarylacetoacetase-like C-terminal domain-containing protein n=1 Tax=Baekduia soli TaxID=496014 RepID=A0A5B8U377_9ACTN|nr:fumarylacetoacetate hydrolase family protein [Baekduia soli]QEC47392.1 hypothetical protein FSW04_07220 [Baekduia soli]
MDATDPRIAAGLQAQAGLRRQALDDGAQRLGWKAGFGTRAAKEGFGISGPIVGFITDRNLLADGAECSLDGWTKPHMEPEVAVRLGRDVAPGATREEALDAVEAVAPAIELIDLTFAPTDLEAVLSGNVFHRHVVLGAFTPVGGDIALGGVRLDVEGPGETSERAVDPSGNLGDLAEVVRHLAGLLPAADDALRAGDVVITGSVIAAVPVAAGDHTTVSAPGMGSVSLTLT